MCREEDQVLKRWRIAENHLENGKWLVFKNCSMFSAGGGGFISQITYHT